MTYIEMSRGLAKIGVEKWIFDTGKMTMIYRDKTGREILAEQLE